MPSVTLGKPDTCRKAVQSGILDASLPSVLQYTRQRVPRVAKLCYLGAILCSLCRVYSTDTRQSRQTAQKRDDVRAPRVLVFAECIP